MITLSARTYDYYKLGELDSYGQAKPSNDAAGRIKIAIYSMAQSVQDNIRYKDATYLGLTHDSIDDSCVIQYGDEKLKVLYVNTQGRYNQVFMKNI